jgi:putative hemolysin
LFLFVLRPAIHALNGLGNLVLRLFGLRTGTVEESLHSPEELKLLVSASQEGGLLQEAQQELVERVLNIGDRRISDIMTPRVDVDWIDMNDDRDETIRRIRECRHGQLLVGRGSIDEPSA